MRRYKMRTFKLTRTIQQPVALRKHTYFEYHNLSAQSGVGAPGTYSYRMNSMYDPDLTSTGHQPYGFDEMMVLYTYYQVLAVRFTFTLISQTTSTVDETTHIIGAVGHQDVTAPTWANVEAFIEDPTTRYMWMGPTAAVTNWRQGRRSFTAYFDPAKFLGLNRNNEQLKAVFNANPVADAYVSIFNWSPEQGEQANALRMGVRIDFITKYTDPLNVGQS